VKFIVEAVAPNFARFTVSWYLYFIGAEDGSKIKLEIFTDGQRQL